MEPTRQTSHTQTIAFLLLISTCVCHARTRPTYDAPAATPPQFGAIAPSVSSLYKQHPNYWSRDLPDDFYQAYHPMAAYPRRRPYFYEYPRPPYASYPLRGQHPTYDPYLDRAYRRDDGDPYTAFARPWRYHSPYLQTRYFENLPRPSWHRPSYTYFQSGVPSFSGFVSLPARFFYPHLAHVGSNVFNGNDAMPERRPAFDQYLVFIPLRQVMNRPDLLGQTLIGGDVGPVYQPGKPVAGAGDHAVPDDGDLNQSHVGALESQSNAESYPSVPVSVYPLQGEDEVVGQSEEGATSTEAGETTSAEDIVSPTSTDKPEQSAGEMAAVTSPPQGDQLSEENGGEVVTESQSTPEEQDEHVYATEAPATDSDEETEPFTQSEEVTEESVEGDDGNQETTTAEKTKGDHETTTKPVYVQLHLLAQDGESTTATPSTTRTPAIASESNLVFLGMNMPREEPEASDSQRDRIYKRYSDNRPHGQLSLDFKTGHVKPAIV